MTMTQLLALLAICWIATGLGRFIVVTAQMALYAMAKLFDSNTVTVTGALLLIAAESVMKGPLFTWKLKSKRWTEE